MVRRQRIEVGCLNLLNKSTEFTDGEKVENSSRLSQSTEQKYRVFRWREGREQKWVVREKQVISQELVQEMK